MPIIYSITSEKGPKVYIGSTIMTLAQRKACHKKAKRCRSIILFNEYGWENCVFAVLEVCEHEIQYVREKHYIQNTENVVNKAIPGKSDEEKKESIRQYYVNNQERIQSYRKEHYKQNWDKCKEYREENKDRLHAYDKEYQLKNRERELQRKRDWN
jgi:hypothetical protein